MHRLYFPQILVAASGREVISHDIVDSEYLYDHVCCCQLPALHDFFPNVSTFLCQIRNLVRDATHRDRGLYSSACAAHPACDLGIGIMPIQAQSLDLSTELSKYYNCGESPDYKYCMRTARLTKAFSTGKN